MQLACVLKRRNNPPLSVVSRGFGSSPTHFAGALQRLDNQSCQPELNGCRNILFPSYKGNAPWLGKSLKHFARFWASLSKDTIFRTADAGHLRRNCAN